MKYLLFLFIFLTSLVLPNFADMISVYAVERETVLTIDSFRGNDRVCQELTIMGKLHTIDDYNISGVEILIKNDPSLNKNNVLANTITDVRGEFFVKTFVPDKTGIVETYAVFLGDSNYDPSVSESRTMDVRAAYSYDPPCGGTLTASVPQSEIFVPFPAPNTTPTIHEKIIHQTTLNLLIREGSEPKSVNVKPELRYGSNFSLNIHTIDILGDGKYVGTIRSNTWSGDIDIENVNAITAIFPGLDDQFIAYTPSDDDVTISSSFKSIDDSIQSTTIDQTPSQQIAQNVEQFVRLWDWGAVVLGMILGFFIKIILEHWKSIKTLKNIAFIIGAIVLIVLFAISEDNDISNNLEIFDPEQLVQTDSPNYFVFGILFVYIAGWIKEILRDHEIYPKKKMHT